MRRLLEMIDQVKRQSAIRMLDPVKIDGTTYDEGFKTEMFFHFIEHCQPFVFSAKNKSPEEIDGLEILQKEIETENDLDALKIDAPFKVWSAEIAGESYITVPRTREGDDIFSIISFVAVEQSPGDFMYFILAEWPRGDGSKNFQREVFLTVTMDEVAKALIKRLYSEKTGIEPGRFKIKLGTGKTKRFVKIQRVIHIRPKKLVSVSTKTDDGREIDWSHRWTVRGCWVELGPGRIGKDREGNYCIDGKTWRVEHIKGPENMPLIQKTRVVEE